MQSVVDGRSGKLWQKAWLKGTPRQHSAMAIRQMSSVMVGAGLREHSHTLSEWRRMGGADFRA